jgi:hypothetical protein
MALAHNVTPTMDDNGQIQYQVSTFHSKINWVSFLLLGLTESDVKMNRQVVPMKLLLSNLRSLLGWPSINAICNSFDFEIRKTNSRYESKHHPHFNSLL